MHHQEVELNSQNTRVSFEVERTDRTIMRLLRMTYFFKNFFYLLKPFYKHKSIYKNTDTDTEEAGKHINL